MAETMPRAVNQTRAVAAYRPSTLFTVGIALYALVVFGLLVYFGRTGQAWPAVAAAYLASPVPMLVVSLIEGATVRQVVDLRTASWAFVIGDFLALPALFFFAAKAWKQLPDNWWGTSRVLWTWIVAAAVLGVAFGFLFHFIVDGPGYENVGAVAQLGSRSKRLHDFVAYPALSGAVMALMVPLIHYWIKHPGDSAVNNQTQLALYLGLGGWILMGALDTLVHKPSPLDLHPPGKKW